MGPLAYALDNLRWRIPEAVLRETFKEDDDWRSSGTWQRAPVSLDEKILVKIVRPRVLIDCNLIGGLMVNIPLSGVAPSYMDNYSAVYQVPKDRTQNRSIVSVLSVGYMPYAAAYNSAGPGFGNVSASSINDINNAAQRVSDSVSGMPQVSNASVELISENTVLLRDQFRVTSAYILRCILSNDENLNNLNARSYPAFARLVELAVKAYIYNRMLIRLDQAFLQGGQELGSFKNYVESLSDSEEMYRTQLNEVMRVSLFINDVPSYNRFIKLQINPGL